MSKLYIIEKGIVFSEDIDRIFDGINAFDFNYQFRPSKETIRYDRKDFRQDTCRIFRNNVTIVSEDQMMDVNNLFDRTIPVVTLDKIYIKPDEKNIFFLDCTRVSGTDEIIARKDESVDDQITRIANSLPSKEILLADDVVFTGRVLNTLIEKFKEKGITVVGIVAGISSWKAFIKYNKELRLGIETNFLMAEKVKDQICERDFYLGVAGSGIMLSKESKEKQPYFIPFGDPKTRASIPERSVRKFSIGCIERSIRLWEDIDSQRGTETLMSELPEKIAGTNDKDPVVKTLRRTLKTINR